MWRIQREDAIQAMQVKEAKVVREQNGLKKQKDEKDCESPCEWNECERTKRKYCTTSV